MALNQGPNLGAPLPTIGAGLNGESVENVAISGDPQPEVPPTTSVLDDPASGLPTSISVADLQSQADKYSSQ